MGNMTRKQKPNMSRIRQSEHIIRMSWFDRLIHFYSDISKAWSAHSISFYQIWQELTKWTDQARNIIQMSWFFMGALKHMF